jgi:hypothetical protein
MKIHQNFVVLVYALGFALSILLANMVLLAPDSMLRMGFAAALFLVGRDMLASIGIAVEHGGGKNADRWIRAFYLALYMGSFMLLALWRGIDYLPELLVGVTLGAALFGGLTGFVFAPKPYAYPHHFDLENPRMAGPLGQRLYYTAPALKLALIIALVRLSPPTTAHLFFYILLIGFTFPRYRRKTNGNWLWANFPTLLGYLMLAALLSSQYYHFPEPPLPPPSLTLPPDAL